MRTHQLTHRLPHKHRATVPVPPSQRPAPTGAHRGSRDLPVAAALGVVLLLVAAYLALTT